MPFEQERGHLSSGVLGGAAPITIEAPTMGRGFNIKADMNEVGDSLA